MTTAHQAAPAGPLDRTGRRRILTTLCVTELASWGVLFYAFPVLLTDIAAATGWSAVTVTAAFSGGQVIAALTGIPVGRRLDRHGPRGVMSLGSFVAVAAVVLVATAQNLLWFVAAWLLVGVAMGAVLYPPAFAALTRSHGADRVRALTVLTLAGGLASTVFAPLTAALSSRLDWRETYLVLAVVLAVVTVPGHLWGLRGRWPAHDHAGTAARRNHRSADVVATSRPFLALVVALTLTAFAAFAVVINLVPLLTERGIGAGTASIALGLGGLGQVAGRIGYGALARHTSVTGRTILVLATTSATTALLGVLDNVAALMLAAVVAGVARGIFTLLQATAVTDRWGTQHYGRLTGLLSAPMTLAMALAPWVGAYLASILGGYNAAFLVLAAVSFVAAVIARGSKPTTSERHP